MIVLDKNFEIDSINIPTQIINDKMVSLKGKGLYLFMISKPDNWDFSLNGLAEQSKESRTSILRTMDELIKLEYMSKIKNRYKGRQSVNEYKLYLEPRNF